MNQQTLKERARLDSLTKRSIMKLFFSVYLFYFIFFLVMLVELSYLTI